MPISVHWNSPPGGGSFWPRSRICACLDRGTHVRLQPPAIRMRKIRIGLSGSSHYAIGLMSGTSHDGISAALVRIQERRGAQVKLLAFKTYPFASRFRSRLLRASALEKVRTPEISTLNFGLGGALA